jgi:O-antigen/teichoic acid export membrane protein
LAGTLYLAQNGGAMVVWIILAVVFIVLLVAYMRVRGRRLSR